MTKKDLLTGDIIVNRGGYLGVVLKDEDTILYQLIGSDSLFEFNDDLTFDDEDYRDGDIMQVYRGNTFLDVENDEGMPIYQRDFYWQRPSKEEIEAREKTFEEQRQKKLEEMRKVEAEKKNDKIFIIAQQFYGNRTATEIERDNVNFFLKGILSPELFPSEDKTVDKKIINVPNTDNIVIVYDQNQENAYIAEDRTDYISCEIPEINFKIHTRCFACRIGENGELQSLENGDGEKFIEYFVV